MANLGVISSLIGKNDLVLSDKLNHASLIEACKLCNAKLSIFKHNNMSDLIHKIIKDVSLLQIQMTGSYSIDKDLIHKKERSLDNLVKLIELNIK